MMKFNKKPTIVTVFLLGAVILATSAFADIALGSGYYNLKNSIKTTSAKLADDVDNFSIDLMSTVKVNGKIIAEETANEKYDIINQAQERNGTSLNKGELRESYFYANQNQSIYKNHEDGSYDVIEKGKPNKDRKIIEIPFEDQRIQG